MKATRRTVLGWLLASVLVFPKLSDPYDWSDQTWTWVMVPVMDGDCRAQWHDENETVLLPIKFKVEMVPFHANGRCI